MNRPTHDELEAMAVRLDAAGLDHNPFDAHEDAADMLRALSAALKAAEARERALLKSDDQERKALVENASLRHRLKAAEARAEAAESELAALKAELAEAVADLQMFVYETTHLSPIEDDGSHWCKISAECLSNARAFLARHQKEADT